MHPVNWLIVVVYLVYVVADGLRRARGTTEMEGYFLANRNLPWWAVGLSVMATQLSAVTMIGTTGQGATDGLRFVQFYFGLPLAMVILGVTLVPFLHGAKVFTARDGAALRRYPLSPACCSRVARMSRGSITARSPGDLRRRSRPSPIRRPTAIYTMSAAYRR